jgi:ethanolamine utilization protein EutN
MFLGKVRGTVVATAKVPSLHAQRLLLVQPYTWEEQEDGDLFAAVDLIGAGRGEWIVYVKGREAANALPDKFNPSDRTILGIVDAITLESLRDEPVPGTGATGG